MYALKTNSLTKQITLAQQYNVLTSKKQASLKINQYHLLSLAV